MKRRELMIGLAALSLVPGVAWAREKKAPALRIRIKANVEHRRQPVNRKKVKVRFALYTTLMDRTPLWDEIRTVNIDDGVLEVEIGRGLGTVDENPFGDEAYLGIFVLDMGPAVADVKLSPRLTVDWTGTGTAPCLLQDESLAGGLDSGGSCTVAGEGAVAFYITELQRVPTNAEWEAEKAADAAK